MPMSPMPAAPAGAVPLGPPPVPVPYRSIAWQALALAAVVALGAWIVHNAAANLAARHIASGFGFLHDSAGFAIAEGPVPYEPSDSYARAFAAGLANTLRAAVPAVVLATLLGFAVGIALVSRVPLLRAVSRAYVDIVRNVPLLVQVLMWYFALTELLPASESPLRFAGTLFLSKGGAAFPAPELPAARLLLGLALTAGLPLLAWRARRLRWLAQLAAWGAVAAAWLLLPVSWERPEAGVFGVAGGASLSPEWLALVAALTQYAGAYCAEIVRAGLMAVSRGQWEAAHALGLTRGQALRRVVLPQGLRVIVPPYASLVMNTVKNSSLAIAVGYPDIVYIATTSLNQNGQAIECIAVIAAVYLSLNLLTAMLMAFVNRRVQFRER